MGDENVVCQTKGETNGNLVPYSAAATAYGGAIVKTNSNPEAYWTARVLR